jgi:3-methylcrotonyl-CoA carboxylase beta subunit
MTKLNPTSLAELITSLAEQEADIRLGGGQAAIERQHKKGRLTARERIEKLIDPGTAFLELGLWAAWGMYAEWGGAPAAGVVTGIGTISGRRQMIIANDATVKAGAFFPATAKKVLRAQRIAAQNRLPIVYLVDSAGIFLPLQEDVFPDEDDFGRIFRNNAVISAMGLGQIAAIMGNCVAGGGYLPVLCDKLLMTEGSGLYLAGPALVKSAIGQEVSHEKLGGAAMHAQVSGTIDYRDPNDDACLERLRRLAAAVRPDDPQPPPPFRRESAKPQSVVVAPVADAPGSPFPIPHSPLPIPDSSRPATDLHQILTANPNGEYEVRDVLNCLVDAGSFDEYKPEFGQTLVCGTARLGGFSIGIVANQHHRVRPANGPYQFGGVLYVDSAEKAARFVMNCNQDWLPILFIQDVNGFMVGRDAERSGIIKAGAKLVSAISNSRVPKITLITGGSYGAGNYALCGKAFDPRFIFAWPTAHVAVMGADQAADTLLEVAVKSLRRQGGGSGATGSAGAAGRGVENTGRASCTQDEDAAELEKLRDKVRSDYERQTDVRYAAARGWVDAILDPAMTRDTLIAALEVATRHAEPEPFRLGVFQV